ncbi:hypothetical protein RV18_GL003356 [Enterococcus termitis]|nr:hypothetical protein RV18_GL003356 [Enterococcus termitis]
MVVFHSYYISDKSLKTVSNLSIKTVVRGLSDEGFKPI